jgi:glutamate dehydrogenase/leucine dehydrogenase
VSADVLCPCALGGLLTDELAPAIRAEIIVGAANNQLAHAGVADTLESAGILYVPDFLANAGGIINIAEEARGYDPVAASKAVERIGETTANVLDCADVRHITPLDAARQLVAERLNGARERLGLPGPATRTAGADGPAPSGETTRHGPARAPEPVPGGPTASVKRAARLPS